MKSNKNSKKKNRCPILKTAIDDLEPLKAEVKRMKDEVYDINKTVFKGNGKPPIISQLANLENEVKNLSENIDLRISSLDSEISLKFKHITELVSEKFTTLAQQIEKEFKTEQSLIDKKWSFKVALFTGTLASITSIAVVLLTEFFKNFH